MKTYFLDRRADLPNQKNQITRPPVSPTKLVLVRDYYLVRLFLTKIIRMPTGVEKKPLFTLWNVIQLRQ